MELKDSFFNLGKVKGLFLQSLVKHLLSSFSLTPLNLKKKGLLVIFFFLESDHYVALAGLELPV